MAMQSRIHSRGVGVIAVLTAMAIMASCGVQHQQLQSSSPKHVSVKLDATDVKIVEARFDSAELEFSQGDKNTIVIEGDLFCEASDRQAAEIQVSKLDLQIAHGRVTLLGLSEAPAGFKHNAKLKIVVPRSVNLRVVQGDGSISGELTLPLMTDIQLGTGAVDLRLPRETSAFVMAQVNIASPPDFVVKDFEKISGEPVRQLTDALFEGQIGTPLQLVGSRLEVRVNAGSCKIYGREVTPATP